MNNPNPFVPKGSILEQQSKRRSRLKLAVFCSLAVGVIGLSAMLIQGCKREQPADTGETPTVDTNTLAVADTNAPTIDTNLPVMPPVASNTPPPVVVTPPPVEAPAGTEYVVVAHDTLGKIAKKFGVSLKALEAANPGVVPQKLKIGYKLTIPAGGGTATAPEAAAIAGGQTYVVKSNDNFWKIARHFGTTLKALEAANPGVDSSHIKVGQKLNIPTKAEAAAPAPEPTPVVTPTLPPPTNLPSAMPTH